MVFRKFACSAVFFSTTLAWGMDVSLNPSPGRVAPLGAPVTFTATASDLPSGQDHASPNLWYRFRVRKLGGEYQIVRDYSPVQTFEWAATKNEGMYEVEVSVRNLDGGGDRSSTTSVVEFQSLIADGKPIVSPTANSLVFIYSAPPCARGSRVSVQFQSVGTPAQRTPYQACTPGLSENFYLAGMLPNTTYTAHQLVDTGSAFVNGADLSFVTGAAPAGLYTDKIVVPRNAISDTNPILLGGPLGASPVANDLAGNVLWYGPPDATFLTRVQAGGEFWGLIEAAGDPYRQIVRKFDLVGMTLLETNAARVNEQLRALGKRQISGFHHEARPLSGGRVAILAGVERILTDVQGPGDVDVLGDMIVVLDQNLNVVWTWDAFDNLDTSRMATLGEQCPNAGCPTFYLAPTANDWTHGNAIQFTPDGNFLYSARNQDWLIKIFFDGGTGDGHVMWKLGLDGDFQIESGDPYPWFSHQHDGNFAPGDPTKLLVFDDGNKRRATLKTGNSRGQVFRIDEQNRVVTSILNADLGVYSGAVGSAQALRNGNYHFDAGFVAANNSIESYSIEVDPSGRIQYEANQNVILYRTFRMTDMYTPN